MRGVIEPAVWTDPTVRGQFVDVPGWEPLLFARLPNGEIGAALVAKGDVFLCGPPIFDVSVRLAAFPPLPGDAD
jgi:hypothetical protein